MAMKPDNVETRLVTVRYGGHHELIEGGAVETEYGCLREAVKAAKDLAKSEEVEWVQVIKVVEEFYYFKNETS